MACESEFVIKNVDRDDALCTRQCGCHHGVQTDSAEPQYRDRGAGWDRCGIDHRADAGDDGAAEEGSVFQRDVFLDWDNGPFGEDHVLGVAGNAGRMIDDLAI